MAKSKRRKARRPARPRKTAARARTSGRATKARVRFKEDIEHRSLAEEKQIGGFPPSTLTLDKKSSAARSGRAALKERLAAHSETNPALTAGDVDADWEQAYSSGDEAPGGDNPTPDQEVVEEIGKALGVEYQDAEELKGSEKITQRDRRRWELDPASSEDYRDRAKKK